MRWQSLTPGGTRTLTSRGRRSLPVPPHVGHGRSTTMPRPPPPKPPPAPKPPKPPPPIGPRRRISSYSLRLAASPRTSQAADTSLNFSSSPPESGWCFFERRRYAALISLSVALSDTPSVL